MIVALDAKRLFNNFTGLGNYSRTLVKNVQHFFPDHEYHLFTPKVQKNKETEYFFDEEKFTIHTPKFYNPLWRSWGVSQQINQLQPDIFHGLSHEIPFGIDPTKTKTLVTFHDLIYEKYPNQYSRWDRFMYAKKYRSSAKRANHIIAISEHTKEDLVSEYHVNKEKITVCYQSCNPAFMDYGGIDLLPTNILGGIDDYFLYVGSIIERKGLLQIILAYSMIDKKNRKPLVVVGNGDQKYIQKVRDMIQYHHLETDIYFVHSISNEDLVSFYDHSFALVYPSIYEGFGIPIIEALYRGKPVITSDLSSLPEAAGPGAIYVNPYDPIDIATAMMQLQDPIYYDKLSYEGRNYVDLHFNSYKTAKKLIAIYESLCNKEA